MTNKIVSFVVGFSFLFLLGISNVKAGNGTTQEVQGTPAAAAIPPAEQSLFELLPPELFNEVLLRAYYRAEDPAKVQYITPYFRDIVLKLEDAVLDQTDKEWGEAVAFCVGTIYSELCNRVYTRHAKYFIEHKGKFLRECDNVPNNGKEIFNIIEKFNSPKILLDLTDMHINDARLNIVLAALKLQEKNKTIKHLYLNSNQISEIQPETFNGFTNLKWLLLNSNQISEIQPGAFNGLTNLDMLLLNSNQISEIQPGAFNGFTNLIYLSLISNQISEIQPEVTPQALGLPNTCEIILR